MPSTPSARLLSYSHHPMIPLIRDGECCGSTQSARPLSGSHRPINSISNESLSILDEHEEPDSVEPDSVEPDSEEPDSVEPDSEEPDSEEPDSEEPDSVRTIVHCCDKTKCATMLKCRLCDRWFHTSCTDLTREQCRQHLSARDTFVCKQCQCEVRDKTFDIKAKAGFTYSSLFQGLGAESRATAHLITENKLPEARHVWSCENNRDARLAVAQLQSVTPNVVAELPLTDWLRIDWQWVPETDLGVGGFPCQTYSNNRHGHDDTSMDSNCPIVRAMACHLGTALEAQKWKVLILECVASFFKPSEEFAIITQSAKQAGYKLEIFDLETNRDVCIPQHRERKYAVFTRIKTHSGSLKEHLENAMKKERNLDPKYCLDHCLLTTSQLQACGNSNKDAIQEAHMLHPKNQKSLAKLEKFFSCPTTLKRREGLTMLQAQDAHYVIDVRNSKEWSNLTKCAPTVTRSHSNKSIVVLRPQKDPKFRFMLAEEHLLLQGYRFAQIKAISQAVDCSAARIGKLAGNGIALPIITCLIEAVANTFPTVFMFKQ